MKRAVYLAYLLIVMLALPVAVYAEGEAYNPPDVIGYLMFALALILPTAAYFWMRSKP